MLDKYDILAFPLAILEKLNTYMCISEMCLPIYLQGPGEVEGLNHV